MTSLVHSASVLFGLPALTMAIVINTSSIRLGCASSATRLFKRSTTFAHDPSSRRTVSRLLGLMVGLKGLVSLALREGRQSIGALWLPCSMI